MWRPGSKLTGLYFLKHKLKKTQTPKIQENSDKHYAGLKITGSLKVSAHFSKRLMLATNLGTENEEKEISR